MGVSTAWGQAVAVVPAASAASAPAVPVVPAASAASAPSPAPEGPSTLEADDVRAQLNQAVVASGHVAFQRGPLRINADRLTYTERTQEAHALGGVAVLHGGNRYEGPELLLNVESYEGYFLRPRYHLEKRGAGGDAARWDFLGRNRAQATAATYSSCPREEGKTIAWELTADRLNIDFDRNEGVAHGAVLRFYGVPILAGPALSFPVTEARKSGWLAPSFDLDNKAGFQVTVPYYWNLAPNYDMTLAPEVSVKRGTALATEFRYLQPTDQGTLKLHTLPHDKLLGRERSSAEVLLDGSAWGRAFYSAQAMRVSDDDYWKDFVRYRHSITPRLLPALADVSSRWGEWTPYARVHRWQVLQDTDATQPVLAAPYDRFPQLGVRTVQQPLGEGIQLALEAEFNQFVNPDGYRALPTDTAARPTGSRAHALAGLSWLWATPGWRLEPRLQVNAVSYALDAPLASGAYQGQSHITRAIPSLSLDSAWTFERDTEWLGRAVRQTLEPRVLYVNTPYYDQSGLPRFDTALKDFNVDSLYSDNAFSGVDRVSDVNQITTGVTSRVLQAQSGAELVRFGLAQRFALEDQRVTDNDGPPVSQSLSDVLLFGSSNLSRRWGLNAAVQYSHDQERVVRSVLGAHYSPGPYRALNFSYRFKRGESEQVDLAWQWPLYGAPRGGAPRQAGGACGGAWYGAGRVNYSLMERRVTDSVLGLEYDAGCWVGRVVAKRLSTSLSEASTQLGLEIEFVGLSRLGTNNPLRVLKDNIPGYRQLRDDPAATLDPRTSP